MEDTTMYGRTKTFIVPSGSKVTIREQNGEDDDILTNPVEAMSLRNISRFIAGIVVDTDITSNGKLSIEDVENMPSLDRYAIMVQSRIHSIGDTMEFSYTWADPSDPHRKETVNYEVNLVDEFLFDDYSKQPTEEELDKKPNAIPYYPSFSQAKDIAISTSSGKELMFDLLTPKGEAYTINLPPEKQTVNQTLKARNLRLKVDGTYEKVHNFSNFSRREMQEIRAQVLGLDPVFKGQTSIQNPNTGQEIMVPIIGGEDFFFPRES